MRFLIILVSLISIEFYHSQDLEIRPITKLDDKIGEASGLIFLHGKFITLNDSGGDAELYEIDTLNGKVTRKVKVKNAKNVDWEALTFDTKHIYIGDIGNNNGNRTDLKIYKISIEEYLSHETVTAEKINIKYSNQKIEGKDHHNTEYDAESLIVMGDSLYIFSKNWSRNFCHIYALPKYKGDYSLVPVDSFATPGKICDASFNVTNGDAYLVGYNFEPFFLRIKHFRKTPIQNNQPQNVLLGTSSPQVEGVTNDGNQVYYVSELFKFGSFINDGELSEIPQAKFLGDAEFESDKISVSVTSNFFSFNNRKGRMKSILVKDNKGSEVLHKRIKAKQFDLDKSVLIKGNYIVEILLSSGKTVEVKISND